MFIPRKRNACKRFTPNDLKETTPRLNFQNPQCFSQFEGLICLQAREFFGLYILFLRLVRMQTNHLSHFLLTALCMPLLEKAGGDPAGALEKKMMFGNRVFFQGITTRSFGKHVLFHESSKSNILHCVVFFFILSVFTKKATQLKKGSQISMFRTIWTSTSFENMPIAEKKTSNPSGKKQVRDVQMSNALGVDISFCCENAQLTGLDEELTKTHPWSWPKTINWSKKTV